MLRIDIVQATAGELIERLGPAGFPEFAPALHGETTPERPTCAAILRQGDTQILLDACFPHGGPLIPRDDLFPYHAWHGEQSKVSFWQAAYSWTIFWQTVLLGEHGDPCWMDLIMSPLTTTSMLGFLDLSCGRFAWHFQLELAYRLADDNSVRATAFRKGWNRQSPDARMCANQLRLPDGSTLMEAIEAHHTYAHVAMNSVPVRAAHLLVKA